MQVTTITQKGQVTIPQWVRKMTNLKPRQRVVVTLRDNEVVITPAIDFFSLRGSVKTRKPFNIKKMTEAAQKYVTKRYAKARKKGY